MQIFYYFILNLLYKLIFSPYYCLDLSKLFQIPDYNVEICSNMQIFIQKVIDVKNIYKLYNFIDSKVYL